MKSETTRLLRERLAQPPGDTESERIRGLAVALLEDAVRENASDIHLDPVTEGYEVRLRIDGALVETLLLPPDPGLHLVRFFKANADLDPSTYHEIASVRELPALIRRLAVV